MQAYKLKALLTHLTLTAGKWGDTDLFIGTEKKWDSVNRELKQYD